MNTVTVKQSDIQELLFYAQQNQIDFFIAGYGKNPLIAFLEKYANHFTFKTYTIGGLECNKKSDFKSPYHKGFCTLDEFIAERKHAEDSKFGITEIVDFEDYTYLTKDEAGTFLIEFSDLGIQNSNEFAEVHVADLESLISFAESSDTPRELHFCSVISTDKSTGFATKTFSLMSLAKFKELWYKLDRKYECECKHDWGRNCDCEGYKEGYDLFPICKVRKLKEGHTFKFETPCTSDKYTHSVSFPSNLS